jgi:hypothetical protein
MSATELAQLVDMSFEHAFLSENEKLDLRKVRHS